MCLNFKKKKKLRMSVQEEATAILSAILRTTLLYEPLQCLIINYLGHFCDCCCHKTQTDVAFRSWRMFEKLL